MKIYGQLLALSALQGAAAFFVHSPKLTTSALWSSNPPPQFGKPTPPMGAPSALSKGGSNSNPATATPGVLKNSGNDPWGIEPDVKVEGDSLRTWSFVNPESDSELVVLKTDGRPLNANVDLWIGPDWTPYTMQVYTENGSERPFRTMVGTKGVTNTLAVKNTAAMEFPLSASCEETTGATNLGNIKKRIMDSMKGRKIEGGAVFTTPFDPKVNLVQVLLTTQGMKLNARIELLQGPNNIKQAVELHTNDGLNRPFYALLEAPGSGNVVRVVNLSTLEFPIIAYITEG